MIELRVGTILYKSIDEGKVELIRIINIQDDEITCLSSITDFEDKVLINKNTLLKNYNSLIPLYVISYVETINGDRYLLLRLDMDKKTPGIIIDHTNKLMIYPTRDKFNPKILKPDNVATFTKYSLYLFDNIINTMGDIFTDDNSNKAKEVFIDSEVDKFIYDNFHIEFIDTEVDLTDSDKMAIEEYNLYMNIKKHIFSFVNTKTNTYIIK